MFSTSSGSGVAEHAYVVDLNVRHHVILGAAEYGSSNTAQLAFSASRHRHHGRFRPCCAPCCAPSSVAVPGDTTGLLHLRSPLCERVGRSCLRLWTVLVAASLLLSVLLWGVSWCREIILREFSTHPQNPMISSDSSNSLLLVLCHAGDAAASVRAKPFWQRCADG